MNNKGFTMVELIMVILILGVLALLSTPNVLKMLERNKRSNYNDTIDTIIEASELYASDNRYDLVFNDNCNGESSKEITTSVTLRQLVDNKNISESIINHCNNEDFNLDNVSVKITLSCSNNSFINFSIIGLTTKENVTDTLGRINEGYFCNDLY